ncbi:hypothetical protein ACJJTC_006923 [Scirpophaga incertulas]
MFWPAFGSKTDRTTRRQSGWLIQRSDNLDLDMVRWLKLLLQLSSSRRGARISLDNLFITTRGEVKPASRTVIANWIKPVFIELGRENFSKHYYKSVSAPSLHSDNILLSSFVPI